MKFELTMRGGIQPKPVKSIDVHSPVIMPLNKPKILFNNIPAHASPVSPSPPVIEPTAAKIINSNVAVTFRMHQNIGQLLVYIQIIQNMLL